MVIIIKPVKYLVVLSANTINILHYLKFFGTKADFLDLIN